MSQNVTKVPPDIKKTNEHGLNSMSVQFSEEINDEKIWIAF